VYPKYGDIAGAWAQKHIDANQYLEVYIYVTGQWFSPVSSNQ
jgi:hypothetical protein